MSDPVRHPPQCQALLARAKERTEPCAKYAGLRAIAS